MVLFKLFCFADRVPVAKPIALALATLVPTPITPLDSGFSTLTL